MKTGNKESSWCSGCRRNAAARHRRTYYARLDTDKRHELTQRRRVEHYGAEHEPYSRTEIMNRWGHKCAYCDDRAEHLDHFTPLSRGGADAEHNILPACAPCNLSKGALLPWQWCLTFPGVVNREEGP
ncbi:HNH endonuclease [Streptomyces lycii]|uniref:HNH endonuclease n=1 Tax=Streptomyces lycii TaxID=2654337 RepID=A0ABQ7FKX2_9ACTN|nr:HNH endonuclease [Streptomyces lycii]KAF4408628.1 HNH endonuclease [Streptomyces lycii]